MVDLSLSKRDVSRFESGVAYQLKKTFDISENICYFLDMMKMVLDIYYREDGELKCVGGVVTVKRMQEVLAYWRKNKRSLSLEAKALVLHTMIRGSNP
jgi:hypothetical protein